MIEPTDFTPLSAAIGGMLIGLSAGLLWITVGRTAGVSGVFGGVVPFRKGDIDWRLAFLIVLPIGAIIGSSLGPKILTEISDAPPVMALGPLMAIIAGILVGAGTDSAEAVLPVTGFAGLPVSRRGRQLGL